MSKQATFSIRIPEFRRWLLLAAMLYLLFPGLLFLLGWVHWGLALPLVLVLLSATVFVWWQIGKNWLPASATFVCSAKDIGVLIVALLIALFMVEAISFHAHLYQPGDFWIRNPIYKMLLTQDWPIYGQTGKQFIYYHDFWLVPAAVSRMLFGVNPATVIFLWSYMGVALAVMLFFVRFRGRILWFMMFLCLFGTVTANLNPIYTMLKMVEPEYSGLVTALEYLGYGTTTRFTRFWNYFCSGFNSVVPMLLLVAILFSRCVPVKYLMYIAGLGASYSPLGAILMLPYLLLAIFNKHLTWRTLRDIVFNVPLWICVVYVCLHAMFFSGLMGQEGGLEWRMIWSDSVWLRFAPEPFRHPWVRVGRVALVYGTFFIPLYFMMGYRFRKLLLWKLTALLALLMLVVVYGCMNNELLDKGSTLMFIVLSVLLCVRYATAGRQRKGWILALLTVSCLHVPCDLFKRGLLEYSWSPEAVMRHTEDPLHGTIDRPDFRHYQNFWGNNKFAPLLYRHPGEGMQHFPLKYLAQPTE